MNFRRRRRELRESLAQMRNDLDGLRSDLEKRNVELRSMNDAINDVGHRLVAFDERLTLMSTTLTNQFHELDGEIQKLAATSDTATAERVEQLRTSQTRLASEQARYAIAFRQDLAELAELLRRAR